MMDMFSPQMMSSMFGSLLSDPTVRASIRDTIADRLADAGIASVTLNENLEDERLLYGATKIADAILDAFAGMVAETA